MVHSVYLEALTDDHTYVLLLILGMDSANVLKSVVRLRQAYGSIIMVHACD